MDKMGIVLSEARPSVPGCDFAGIIHSSGKNSRWAVGQEVHGMSMQMNGKPFPSLVASVLLFHALHVHWGPWPSEKENQSKADEA